MCRSINIHILYFSTTPGTRYEERLQNDSFYVEWNGKP